MPLVPGNALKRTLKWSDFTKEARAAPSPGVTEVAAETIVELLVDDMNGFQDPKSKGQWKLRTEPTIRINFKSESWVADYVLQWPKDKQAALLDHEQIHYLISVLSARDEFNAIQKIAHKKYATGEDLVADIDKAQALGEHQDIEEKYDDDTDHGAIKDQQVLWAKGVRYALE